MIKTKRHSLSTRLRLAIRRRKHTADDNIERSEPDMILPVFMDFLFGIVMTVLLAMLAYSFMNGSMAEWIAHFIAAQDNSFGFDERFAAFTASVIVLAELVVIFGVALNRKPDTEDLVDALGDLGEEIDERFVELENEVHTGHNSLQAALDDLTPGIPSIEVPDDVLAERLAVG